MDNFKINNTIIFWNLVCYLQLNNMDISFILPYMPEIGPNENINLGDLKKFIDKIKIRKKNKH